MRTLFFLINLFAATLVLGACLVSLIVAYYEGSSFATLGGFLLLAPAVLFARGEWLAFFRRDGDRERRLGFAYLGVAGFAAFGLAANVAEGLSSSWPRGFGWFVASAVAITAYLIACGLCRVCRRPSPPEKGQ
jgi:hypothetical protein